MTEDQHGRATPGGEAPSSDRPLTPEEGARSETPRPPGDDAELGYFRTDEQGHGDEQPGDHEV